MNESVYLDHNRLVIDGTPRVLLCASLFPFRVPREQWGQRLEAVKRLGYHAIDVYIPWNFHETAPGVWDFSGRRDIDEFLRLTHEAGLYAMVRPGPYICSEWDGGAIPAWIATDPARGGGDALRQNDPAFLDAVRGWYDRILPIIVRRQYGHGGPVIAVQADNELDFFACRDPRGYIGALAGMMREAGVDVPIVACAGQGDMARAFGGADGVVPAVNLYADDDGVDMDAHVRYYRAAADRYDAPLIVTETNRLHRTLRRMVGSGARFVGPFLQVSGWDFDYGTSVNNWGALESYMTHDYDFGGVIDPAGRERPDADEARRLSAIIAALGERLAEASPAADQTVGCHEAVSPCLDGWDGTPPDGIVSRDGGDGELGVGVLDLAGGGRLLTLTNVSGCDLAVSSGSAAVSTPSMPDVVVPAGVGVMVVSDLPVDDRLTLCATNGELIGLDVADEGARITLSPPVTREDGVWATFVSGTGADVIAVREQTGDTETRMCGDVLFVSGSDGRISFSADNGERVYEIVISRPDRRYVPSSAPLATVDELDSSGERPAWSPVADGTDGGRALPAEDVGVYAGAVRYTADVDGATTGVVLRDAADTISVRCGGVRTAWRANGGAALYVPFDDADRTHAAPDDVSPTTRTLEVTARIWGHSNFDDSRLLSLRLTAKRGITGALAVSGVHDLGSGWLTGYDPHDPAYARSLRDAGLEIGEDPRPRGGFGGWSTTTWPHRLAYMRTLHVGDTVAALHVDGGRARCDVRLNGRDIGSITPLRPTLWLGDVHDGDELAVIVWRTWGEDAGRATLLTGREVVGWTMAAQGLSELRAAADAFAGAGDRDGEPATTRTTLPLTVEPGAAMWLRVPAAALAESACSMNTVVRFDGDGLQLTAFTDDLCLGRVVLGGLPGTTFAGGRGDLFLVPEHAGDLLLYVEATRDVAGRLDAVTLGGPVDRG
ncbi:beta-galactosidase [Bifidobacterium sp. MA2]|uniref:Beta-galactosidase n=1 Tax=Bifidobacterium santillanense TaxID=2809028 RepID=A0ABS5UPJ7_9BIFI|nr:beta-galactosidase [Bifidobacterium santillanense]MBT1172778.1 beta-galactosidase [Bifidobacterium santillanense]